MHDVIADPAWVIDLPSATRDGILEELVTRMKSHLGDIEPGRALQALLSRERQCPTVVDDELAVPHARLPDIPAFLVGLARIEEGVEFAPGRRVRMVCLLLGPEGNQKRYLDILASVLRLFQEKSGRLQRAKAKKAAAMLALE